MSALAIAAHLFNPTSWPPLGIDILHSLHGPGFALLGLLILIYFHNQCHSNINYILAAAIAMGIGLLSELAQIPGPRDAQIEDLVVDALGIFGAIGVAASLDKRVRSTIPLWAKFLLPTAAGAALLITFIPTLWFGYALVQQKNAFPTLLSFENRWESKIFGQTSRRRPTFSPAPLDWPGDGAVVARTAEHGRWGIFLSLHPLPDWTEYKTIRFLAASTGEAFAMDLCIRDKRPNKTSRRNRYCTSMTVGPSPREYSISFENIQAAMKDRPFDFSNVAAIVFSAAKPGGNQELLLDDIRLKL